ncbi:MAG TPA: DUF4234 domain-containing protein [Syntrophorhabdaceae bacterium]|jgi:hypothetical protein
MEDRAGVPGGGEKFVSSILLDIILWIITCGIYGLFWTARQMKAVNYLLGREKFSFLKWLLFCLITCGIYHIFYEYSMAQSLVEVQGRLGRPVASSLPVISVILSVIGLYIVADAIQQDEINRLFGR